MLSRLFVLTVNRVPIWLALRLCKLVSGFREESLEFNVSGGVLQTSNRQGLTHFSGTPRRGLAYLTNGLKSRGRKLAEQYLIHEIGSPIETVVDVGANSGDLLLALPDSVKAYLGFEPISEEFSALVKNCEQRNLNYPMNVALSNTSGEVEIYVSTGAGDSSLVQPANGYSEKRKVESIRLDDLLEAGAFKDFQFIDLLKVEAEGFEPEILLGANKFVKLCRWITVDGGPERGPDSLTTIENCTNFLTSVGFSLVSLNLASRKGVGLFRNDSLARGGEKF